MDFCSGGLWPCESNRQMKPHAYARALHLVGWRHGLFELRPVPLLTLFFWYAPTDLWGLVVAGKLNSFGSCTDPWLNLSARHIRYWIPARTHLPKNLWHHGLAHPCYPVHVPLVVGLGYGATRDLADGCWYSTEGGYPECPSYHDGFVVALPSQSKQQIVPTVW